MGNIRALGRLEPETGLIDLSSAAGERRIRALLVEEHQTVSKGEPLVQLVGFDAKVAEIEWINEQVRTAKNQITEEYALQPETASRYIYLQVDVSIEGTP